MDCAELLRRCLAFPGAVQACPFGPRPVCCRVGGRIFAELYPEGVRGALRLLTADERISPERKVPMAILRCDPATGDFFRRQFCGAVLRPYHCPPVQQPYANTVLLDGRVPDAALLDMAEHAYQTVLHRLPKKVQQKLQAQTEIGGSAR